MTEFNQFTVASGIKNIGIPNVSNACGVTDRAVYKWVKNNRLPASAYVGEKPYAEILSDLSGIPESAWLQRHNPSASDSAAA